MANDAATNPSSILKIELAKRAGRNPAYSLRAFARDLGVSHTFLSLVINEKKSLSLQRAYHMASELELPAEQVASFVTPFGRQPKRARSRGSRPVSLANDKFQFISKWYHVAILDLTRVRGFQSDVRWIAKVLGITPKQAGLAIARLERMGLLVHENGVWKKASDHLFVPGAVPVTAIRRFHEQMIKKALRALKSKRPGAFKRRDITGVTMPINPARLPLAQKKIQRFRREMMRFLSEGECTALYQLNVQLFELGGNE